MIKRLSYILIIFLFATTSWADKIPSAGVWSIWDNGGVFDDTTYPFLRGKMLSIAWSVIEPTDGNFSWTNFDANIVRAIDDDGFDYVMIKVYVGPNSPTWVWTTGGVTDVHTTSNTYGQPYPLYIEAAYIAHFKSMIDAVYTRIDGYAAGYRNKIVAIQCPIGKSGDAGPYAGNPDTDHVDYDASWEITEGNTGSSEWEVYQQAMFQYFYDKFKDTDPAIVPIFHTTKSNINTWLNSNTPNHWRKFAKGGHCYQNANTIDALGWTEDVIPESTELTGGWAIAVRDEMDKSAYPGGKYDNAACWFTYWTALQALSIGVDFWNIEDVDEPSIDCTADGGDVTEAYYFFNEYAGYHSPSESHGAWIAFRDSLDYSDTSRFDSSYGTAVIWYSQNAAQGARYNNIADDYSAFGAIQEANYDPDTSNYTGGSTFYTNSCRYAQQNDVGYAVIAGNFSMYISQISPLTYDVGWWRQGGIDELYGRYARGFDYSASKNAIYLDLDNSFFVTHPSTQPVTVRVVYLDETGQWSLNYSTQADTTTEAYVWTNGNTGNWMEKEVTLTDTYFNDAGTQSADIWLENEGTTDLKFHMVEIERSLSFRKQQGTIPVGIIIE